MPAYVRKSNCNHSHGKMYSQIESQRSANERLLLKLHSTHFGLSDYYNLPVRPSASQKKEDMFTMFSSTDAENFLASQLSTVNISGLKPNYKCTRRYTEPNGA